MLGDEVRAIRERKGLTLRDCAEKAGISREALSGVERGTRYPSLRTLEALASCLGVSFIVGPVETIIEEE